MVTRIKICGLTRPEDAELAIELGADAVGFIHEAKSPRCIALTDLTWIEALPPLPSKVAVFGVVDRSVACSVFDLVQGVEWGHAPEQPIKRVHVLRPRPGDTAEGLLASVIPASAFALDAYSETAYGGTGEKIDWALAAEFVQISPLPVILQGGLTPGNVAEAIHAVRPFAVDVSSGVESTPGIKDHIKLRDFIQAARSVHH